MRDTDYAFCVARIRARETKLLTAEFKNKLIEAGCYDDAVKLLIDAGWIEPGFEEKKFFRKQSNDLWVFLKESIPDKSILDHLCILNDYFNIKTAIKCIISGADADLYYTEPTSLDLHKLYDSINGRSFDVFKNDKMQEVAKKAFEIACMTDNGQNAEILIDVATLEFLSEISESSRYKTFTKICDFIIDTSNIRTVIRCAALGKDYEFMNLAVSECRKISKDRLLIEAKAGFEQLRNYLSDSVYATGVELYFINPVQYDKWCDEKILEIATQSEFTAFGFDPVCAYFYRKNNEIKTVKMILSAKKSGMSVEMLKERVKSSYA